MKDDKIHKDIISNSWKKGVTKQKVITTINNNNNKMNQIKRRKYTSLKNKHPEYPAGKFKLILKTFIRDAVL